MQHKNWVLTIHPVSSALPIEVVEELESIPAATGQEA